MMHPEREIRAYATPLFIRVYQAYGDGIADSALKHQMFVSPPFSMSRMTWVKPSFLWMMYRSGWGRKDEGQKRILAIDITHAGFAWALNHSCPSHRDPGMSEGEWRLAKERASVRIQWDPERDLHHRPLPHRAIQIGLSGEAVVRYVEEWIVAITDVTRLAHAIHAHVLGGDLALAQSLLPPEKPYATKPVNHDPYKENEENAVQVLRDCGLPPDRRFIPQLRTLLERETATEERAGNEFLRALCLLLWLNGDAQDAPRIAEAKFSSFDAGFTVDEDFLVCGSLEQTRARLAASDKPAARKALEWIAHCTDLPSKDERIAHERRYYAL